MKKIFLLLFGLILLSSFASAALIDNIGAYYKIDEGTGTTTANAVSSRYNLEMLNTPTWVTGIINNATKFNGVDEYMRNSTFSMGTTTTPTFSIWINVTDFANNLETAISWTNAANNGLGIEKTGSSNQFSLWAYDGTWRESRTGILSANTWYHIVATFNGTHQLLYVNGVLVDFDVNTGVIVPSSEVLFMGYHTVGGADRYFKGIIDEVGIWNVSKSQTEVTELYNNGLANQYPFVGPSKIINVNLTSPANNSIVTSVNVPLIANYTATNLNFSNATYHVYYGNGTAYNTTTMSISGNTTASSTLTLVNLSLGSWLWNVNVCSLNASNSANCSWWGGYNSTFFKGANGSIEYSTQVYETALEQFAINLSIVPGTSISSANLVYNGSIYNASTVDLISSNLYRITKEITIPLNLNPFLNQNATVFWIINYLDGFQQNITAVMQQKNYINLQNCNATFNISAANFTIKNESNFGELNGSIQAFFMYNMGGDISKNYTFNTTNPAGPSRYDFCIFPSNTAPTKNFTTDMTLTYTAPDYVTRFYYLDSAVLTNTTSLIDLLLLPNTLAVQFILDVKKGTDVIDNAIVYIGKKYISLGNIYKTVSIRQTDGVGRFVEFLELNNEYQATIIKDGAVIGVVPFNSICGSAPCELTLQIPDTAGNIFSSYDNTFAGNIAYNLSFNYTNKMVTFTYVDLTGLASYARLLVTTVSLNATGITACDTSLFSVAGTITCNMTNYAGDFRATTYISRSPEKIIDYIDFFISTLKEDLGGYALLLALLFGSVIVGFFFFFDVSLGVLSVPALLTVMKLAHLLPLSWTPLIGLWIIAIFLAGRIEA